MGIKRVVGTGVLLALGLMGLAVCSVQAGETIVYPGKALDGSGDLKPDSSTSGNSVTVNSGTVTRDVLGGLDRKTTGTATASGNTVNINGGTVGQDIHGGEAGVESDPTATVSATTSSNKVNINGGNVGEIRGGMAFSGTGAVTASNNTVTVTGGTVSEDIIGGDADSMGTAIASNNSVSISGVSIGDGVIGGGAGSQNPASSGNATASSNTVTISGGGVAGDIIGGGAMSGSGSATADKNTVTINNATISGSGEILGGGAFNASGTAIASYNTVNLSGVTAVGYIAGGASESDTASSTASNNTVNISGNVTATGEPIVGGEAVSRSGAATASGNEVNITGGTVNAAFIGGGGAISRDGTASASGNFVTISGNNTVINGIVFGGGSILENGGSATGSATNNTVTISGSSNLTASILYGGFVGDYDLLTPVAGMDAFTGNTLIMNSAANISGTVRNFEKINFGYSGNANIGSLDTTATGVVGPKPVQLNTGANDIFLKGNIIGTGSLTKLGSGMLTLGGTANNFASLTVSNGDLVLARKSSTTLTGTATFASPSILKVDLGDSGALGTMTVNSAIIAAGAKFGVENAKALAVGVTASGTFLTTTSGITGNFNLENNLLVDYSITKSGDSKSYAFTATRIQANSEKNKAVLAAVGINASSELLTVFDNYAGGNSFMDRLLESDNSVEAYAELAAGVNSDAIAGGASTALQGQKAGNQNSQGRLGGGGDGNAQAMNFSFNSDTAYAAPSLPSTNANGWMPGTAMWIAPLYTHARGRNLDVSGINSGYRSDLGGGTLGLDYTTCDGAFRFGLAGNLGGGNSRSTAGLLPSGRNTFTFGGVELYAGMNKNNFTLRATGGWSRNANELKTPLFQNAKYDTDVWSAGLSSEYKLDLGNCFALIPGFAVEYANVRQDAFTLRNAVDGTDAFRNRKGTADVVNLPVSLRFNRAIDTGKGTLTPEISGSWIPSVNDRNMRHQTEIVGVGPVNANSQMLNRHSGTVGAGLKYDAGRYTVGAEYQYGFSKNFDNHSVGAIFRIKF